MPRLGSFDFDPLGMSLARAGARVRLSRRTLELLALLAREPGEIVSAQALRESLWPAGFVEDGNLTQHVYLLRQALRADPRVRIETLPRRGYRLNVSSPEPAPAPPAKAARAIARWAFAAVVGFALLEIAGASLHAANAAPPAEALRAFQLGRLAWERRDPHSLDLAQQYFGRTVHLAPGDARGYAGLAAVEAIRGDRSEHGRMMGVHFARAEQYARSALARDWRNADAYDVLGLVAEERHDSKRAESFFQNAQTLDATNAYAHIWYGVLLAGRDKLDEARGELVRGELLDPESRTAARWLGGVEYERRAFDAAAEQFRTLLAFEPRDVESVLYLADIDEARHEYGRAFARLVAYQSLIPRGQRITAMARLEALRGQRAAGLRRFANLGSAKGVDRVELAATELALGNGPAALRTLRTSPAGDRDSIARTLRRDARFDALRRLALERAVGMTLN
jgi:DNA-binding winged helix-turn-helix (wHTH) protein/Tfp pilus assembly protein PilF